MSEFGLYDMKTDGSAIWVYIEQNSKRMHMQFTHKNTFQHFLVSLIPKGDSMALKQTIAQLWPFIKVYNKQKAKKM